MVKIRWKWVLLAVLVLYLTIIATCGLWGVYIEDWIARQQSEAAINRQQVLIERLP